MLTIAALFLVKQFGARPPGVATRVFVNLVELLFFVLLNVFAVPTFFAFLEQLYYFIFVSEAPGAKWYAGLSGVLSAILAAAIVLVQALYTATMDDHRFKRSYLFYSGPFFAAHYVYLLAVTVLYSVVRQCVWVTHGLMTVYALAMLVYAMRNNTFSMTGEILFMLGCVVFVYFLSFALGLLMTLGLLFHVTFSHVWLVFGVFVTSILVAAAAVDKKNRRLNYHDQFVNFHSRFRPRVKAYQDQPLRVDCGVSRNFLFQLACFFGPEYFGQVLPADQEEDVLCRNGTIPALSEEEAAAYASNVNEAESTMEQLKLVYENVYANIYYTYAMCGQTVEHLTLLDIEEALPVPVLLRYCRKWRTEADAAASILDLLQDIKILEQVTAAGDPKYRPDCYEKLVHECQNDTLWTPRERMAFRDVLEQNCVATDFLTSRINRLDAPDARFKKDNASLDPERAFWNNDYQMPSDQKLNGLLAVLSERDFADDALMAKLFCQTRVTDRSDAYFVYVPSYTSRSHVTGNVHRLSFCADHSAIRTPRLRQVHYASLISLARTVFPSRNPHFPLVMRLRIDFASPQVHWTRPFRHIQVGLSAPFSIELVRREKNQQDAFRGSGDKLYQLGQFLIDSANFSQVNTTLLQMIVVELAVQKLVSDGLERQPPHVQGFIQAYEGQKLTFFQKIQLFGPCKNDVHRIEENSQYNISAQVCFNALAVVYGAAALDQRAVVPEDVFR